MKKAATSLVVLLVAALSLIGGPASAKTGTSYAFRLVGPAVTLATEFDEHHLPGDTIRLTGTGTFDSATGAVTGEGSFAHLNADGTLHMSGEWFATGFVSFTSFGGPKPSRQGGVLQLTVMHVGEDGEPCEDGGAGMPMTLTSVINAPEGTVGGVTTGPFGQPLSGTVVFSRV